ncbi:transcriptional regulator [Streptomyces sp. NBC_00690]|uniref:transcriptional regulator n=1 Tax=Streptomyces sp. NBC_00690 TaxID=2975808 RepID=UPI002E2A13BC|nr:helix-turn-helix domain-containing protein [Streptomyces sp. NBC_00690]
MSTDDTEAFAQRLLEMREASGRSYGALARRMAVSASTLHRYCSGRTVPMEFAPIERLARLCGCRGDDLVALHRLWVLADAERTRRQLAPQGAPNPEPGGRPSGQDTVPAPGDRLERPAPPSGSDAASERAAERSATEDAAPAESSEAEAEQSQPPHQRAAAVEQSAPDEGTSATDQPKAGHSRTDQNTMDRSRTNRSVVHDSAVPPLVPEATEVSEPASEAPSDGRTPETTVVLGARRPRRHHRAVYASAALVLTAVGLVLLLAFDRSPFSRADRQRTTVEQPDDTRTGRPSATAPDGRPSASTPSPSASASVPSSGAPKGGPPRVGTGVSGSPTAPKGRTTAPAAPVGTPFSWTLDQHVWKNECDHAYLVDREPSRVPPPPAESDAAPWAGSLGAVHGGETMVRVSVQGKTDQAVVLQSLSVRTVARRTPPQESVYLMSVGCGGSLTPRMFDVDLDAPRPLARSVAGSDAGVEIPAVSFPYRVSASDPEVLLITGRAVSCDCDWYLELEWSSGAQSGTVRIDDRGRPFRTSGIPGLPTYEYDTIGRAWRLVSASEGRGGAESSSPQP